MFWQKVFGDSRKSKRARRSFEIPPELTDYPDVLKYYNQRYRLFSKYDEGIQLDRESW